MRKIILAAIFLLSSISVNALWIQGDEVVDLFGSESLVNIYDTATLTTHVGSSVSFLWGEDNSTINIKGGDIAWLHTYDNNTTNISFTDDLSWLLVNDNSIVNIFGSNFNYINGILHGTWSNGVNFSFWALEEQDMLTGILEDIMPDNIILHSASVPESSSLMLFLSGMLFYFRRKILRN